MHDWTPTLRGKTAGQCCIPQQCCLAGWPVLYTLTTVLLCLLLGVADPYHNAVLLAGRNEQLLMQLGERVGRRRAQREAAEAAQQAVLQSKAREQEQFEAIKAEFGVNTSTVRSDPHSTHHAHDCHIHLLGAVGSPSIGLSKIAHNRHRYMLGGVESPSTGTWHT